MPKLITERKRDKMTTSNENPLTRSGCRDNWNAFMVRNAVFSSWDIPFCPTTTDLIPQELITYEEAKAIYNKKLQQKQPGFRHPSFVCFYLDDYKFDSTNGIWFRWKYALRILEHFAGIITPDFSTCQDFPLALKIYNTYRMRAFGYWYGKLGHAVINNVRWGTKDSFCYSFDGIPTNSIVSIGSVASGYKELKNRPLFNNGLLEMVTRLTPHTILVYGSAKYPILTDLQKKGISVIAYPSKTNFVFQGRKQHE